MINLATFKSLFINSSVSDSDLHKDLTFEFGFWSRVEGTKSRVEGNMSRVLKNENKIIKKKKS